MSDLAHQPFVFLSIHSLPLKLQVGLGKLEAERGIDLQHFE